ncbi:MAG: [FeFe] hydrogenase H-cluster radical SAM maturase HydE [Candidatus Omnitrophica bacterium]|nr:[FeFe] hydrogenase H-cluster radical SAM maturase HydE [Candidatus Omnitrophota bacterium]
MSKEEVVAHLKSDDPRALLQEADRVRQAFCGNAVHLRGLIEFSNHCQRDCLYCGLRRSNQKLPRYRMSADEIFESAKQAGALGYKTIVMQSGVDGFYRIEVLCDLLKKIKNEVDCAVTLCIGERSYEDYRKLREAGADRYLLRFETSDKELFEKLKPDSSYEQRRLCLDWLKELGYQVGSGNMIGLPGQTLEILAEDILLLRDLNLDMIGIGPFIAHPETPLAGEPNGAMALTLKAVALIRILTQNALIPATTAMGSIDPEGRQKALRAGANVIMPNVTPTKYRCYYEIYPHKICINERPGDCASCVQVLAGSVGRTIAKDYGHGFKKIRA